MNRKFNTYTWTAWTLLAMSVTVLTYNPLYHVLLLSAVVLSSIKHGIAFTSILRAGVFFGTPILLINTLLVHQGVNTLYTIPSKATILGVAIPLSIISGPVTAESIGAAVIFMLILVNMMLIFSLFNNITSADSVLRLLPTSLSHSTLLVAIVLRFLPTVSSDVQAISNAQKCRGFNAESGGLLSRIKSGTALVVPTVVNSLERAYNLAESLESRGYSRKRTRFMTEEWSSADRAFTAFFSFGVFYLLASRVFGGLSYWNAMSPYTGTVEANPVIVFLILSLLIP